MSKKSKRKEMERLEQVAYRNRNQGLNMLHALINTDPKMVGAKIETHQYNREGLGQPITIEEAKRMLEQPFRRNNHRR